MNVSKKEEKLERIAGRMEKMIFGGIACIGVTLGYQHIEKRKSGNQYQSSEYVVYAAKPRACTDSVQIKVVYNGHTDKGLEIPKVCEAVDELETFRDPSWAKRTHTSFVFTDMQPTGRPPQDGYKK